MIEVKETAKIALEYLKQLYDTKQFQDVLLEEVALSDDEKSWFVTMGFSRPVDIPDPLQRLIDAVSRQPKFQREYKVFQIDSATGRVKSMKIRDV